jgi:hypothetical protein
MKRMTGIVMTFGMYFESYTTCDSALEVGGYRVLFRCEIRISLARKRRQSCRTYSNILRCTEWTGSIQKVHVTI